MTTTYIIVGQEELIIGVGETEKSAWESAGEVLDLNDEYTRRDLKVYQATSKLLTLLNSAGGSCSWRINSDGIADIDEE